MKQEKSEKRKDEIKMTVKMRFDYGKDTVISGNSMLSANMFFSCPK